METFFSKLKSIFLLSKYYAVRTMSILELVSAYLVLIIFKRSLVLDDIWLVREKGTEARDNGYHFYKYIRERHPEIKAYYVITDDSPDRKKVEKYGNIITLNSFKHYIYYLCARVSVNSQPFGAAPDDSEFIFNWSKRLHRKNQLVIHLKHGVTKDELPQALDYSNTNFSLLCCVSERERLFMEKTHGYPRSVAKTLGFCRYDNLLDNHKVKKQILIMPTHRMWLHAQNAKQQATDIEKKNFENSQFYKIYSELLCDDKFNDIVKQNGYKVVFYPHYAIQPFIQCFALCANDNVKIANREKYDVQELLLESDLLITDYSSVFFDFGYMGKPTIFFQFDRMKYRQGHFKEGYFDYEKDAFGPVVDSVDELIKCVEASIQNKCLLESEYLDRVEDFFAFHDRNNCERIFREIQRKVLNE